MNLMVYIIFLALYEYKNIKKRATPNINFQIAMKPCCSKDCC